MRYEQRERDYPLEKVFFTADQHFGHANIIRFTNRPFANVGEMDAALVANWNAKVPNDGLVFHLGDFTLGDWRAAQEYFGQLNGHIAVLSNPWHHDGRWLPYYSSVRSYRVDLLPPMVVLEIPELGEGRYPLAITLCHYPMAEWDRKHYGGWHLHGHSHGAFQGNAALFADLMVDVGVDAQGYTPVSTMDIAAQMAAKGWHA